MAFKIGDRVVTVHTAYSEHEHLKNNGKGVLVEITVQPPHETLYMVRMDDAPHGAFDDAGWYFYEKELKHEIV